MPDVSNSLVVVAAVLVAVAAQVLFAGGLYWLAVRLVRGVGGGSGVPAVGYPRALAAAVLTHLAQLVALAVVLAPAVAFARLDVTVLSPALVAVLGLLWVVSVAAAVVVARLLLPVRPGGAVAVGAVFLGLSYAVYGTLNAALA